MRRVVRLFWMLPRDFRFIVRALAWAVPMGFAQAAGFMDDGMIAAIFIATAATFAEGERP